MTEIASPPAREVPHRTHRRLARALARECRGRTGVLGPIDADLREALEGRGLEPVPLEERGAPFDAVLVVGTLEHAGEEEAARCLREAWSRLAGDGRLVVCVPNEGGEGGAPDAARFTRRRLRRCLRPLGRPRLVTGQPFRWLVMVVEARPRPSPGVEERYRVIAGLCRGAVLELGCGAGELTRTIAARGHACVGVELSREKVAQARRWHPGLEFVHADILELDTGGRRYDTVVLSEVLEHVEAPTGDAMLQKAWSLLAPGGRLVVSVPNEDCVPHRNHLREFTRRDLAALLRTYGRPRVVTEQPYRYLLLWVRKESGRDPGDDPAEDRGERGRDRSPAELKTPRGAP